jgi:hypothetical protein
MAFDPSFLALMASVATYKPFASDDGYGDFNFGPSSTFPCHVTYKRRIIRTDTEEDAVSTAQIQLPPAGYVWGLVTIPTLSVDDHIVLPDKVERKVLDVTTYTDDQGPHHQSAALT